MISQIRQIHREIHFNYQGDIQKVKTQTKEILISKRGVNFNKIRTNSTQNEYYVPKQNSNQIQEQTSSSFQYAKQHKQKKVQNKQLKGTNTLQKYELCIITIFVLLLGILVIYLISNNFIEGKDIYENQKNNQVNKQKNTLFEIFYELQANESSKKLSLNQFQSNYHQKQEQWKQFILQITNNQNCQIQKVNDGLENQDSLIHCNFNDL